MRGILVPPYYGVYYSTIVCVWCSYNFWIQTILLYIGKAPHPNKPEPVKPLKNKKPETHIIQIIVCSKHPN